VWVSGVVRAGAVVVQAGLLLAESERVLDAPTASGDSHEFGHR
jgi:hypothetical protein